MKNYFLGVKEFIADHRKQFTTGAVVVVALAIIFGGLALYSYNQPHLPKVVFEPARACDLLSLDEARSFLGNKTINGVNTAPAQTANTATSKCGYSDGKVDTANAIVIALIVRSGINDEGIAQNKSQFVNGKPTTDVIDVPNVGDNAYFNSALGQLNILKDSTWIIISYGPGADPTANTLDDAVKLSEKVLNS